MSSRVPGPRRGGKGSDWDCAFRVCALEERVAVGGTGGAGSGAASLGRREGILRRRSVQEKFH